MHTVWKGSISFGLVNIPIKLHAATEDKDVKFRQLHNVCMAPIQYRKVCSECGQEVASDDIVKGIEVGPNQFVVLNDEELSAHQKARSSTIDILDFVHLSDIDPVYFNKSYYVAPENASLRAYRLLTDTMGQTGKIAIAKTVLRTTDTLVCIRAKGQVLVMETLFWPDEVRPTEELPFNNTEVLMSDQELNIAKQLVEQLTKPFSPQAYKDETRESLLELLQHRTDEQAPQRVAQGRAAVTDLMKQLQESLNLSAPPKKGRGRKSS